MTRRRVSFRSNDWSSRDHRSPEYMAWRLYIRKRDNYTCQMPLCKTKSGCVAHHIQRWADYPTLRFDKNNGILLCKEHHAEVKNKEDAYAPLFMQIALSNKMKFEQAILEGKVKKCRGRAK